MNKLLKQIAFFLTVSVPVYAFAASPFLKPVKDLLSDLEIFIKFLNWALPALGVIVFFVVVIVFILNKMGVMKLGEVKGGNLLWALIGLAILFSVYGLIQLLGALVGVDTNRSKTITAPSLPQVGGVQNGGYYNQ
jgi:amino acid transporter